MLIWTFFPQKNRKVNVRIAGHLLMGTTTMQSLKIWPWTGLTHRAPTGTQNRWNLTFQQKAPLGGRCGRMSPQQVGRVESCWPGLPGDGQLECPLQAGLEKGDEGKSGLESSRHKYKALKITKEGKWEGRRRESGPEGENQKSCP